ncbi:MAG: Fic family protein [Bdellovibrionaceae bacterium]|nr:Fic family protein [Pseudobdellovibrionaceae bacterium]
MKRDYFDFLNSSLWINYTQQRYLTPEEIKYRLKQQGKSEEEWPSIRKEIVASRKTGSITLFFKSIEPKFWFYPADIIHKKINDIEKLGKDLYEQINKNASFKTEFLLDSAIEEAITSAIYEGAQSTRAQAEQLIASDERPKNKDEWMLIKNFKAMKWVKNNQQTALSKEVILQLHHIVTENTLEGDDINFQGKFRNDKVFVGPHEGINHGKIEQAINEMIQLTTNNPRYFHPLLKGILVHYFMGYIHPFFDGNGRTARALFYFKSIRNQLNYIELLSVSAYLRIHGKQYENSFVKVKENEYDLTYFIDFCLDSILSALKEVSRKVGYLLRMTDLKERFELSQTQIGLIQRMALHKFRTIDIEEYAQQISKSREFARQELKRLLDLNLVSEIKMSKKLVYKVNAEKLKELYKEESLSASINDQS